MTYIPVTQILTDKDGHFIGVVVCTCGEHNEGNDKTCPVHWGSE